MQWLGCSSKIPTSGSNLLENSFSLLSLSPRWIWVQLRRTLSREWVAQEFGITYWKMPTKHASHKLVCDCNTLYNGCLTLCQAKCSTGVSLSVALHVSDWESISTISGWTLIHYRVFPVLHFPDEYPFIIHLGGEKLCEVIVHKKKTQCQST